MRTVKILFIVIALLLTGDIAWAQFGKRLGEAIGRAAERTATRKAETVTEEAVDAVLDPGSYSSEEEAEQAAPPPQQAPATKPAAQQAQTAADGNAAAPAAPAKLESYTQYDFVPGDQILFYEDFSQDAVGDFPALWSTNSSGEVKTLNNFPGKWLQITAKWGLVTYLNKLELPNNFIIEFDYIAYFDDEALKKNPDRINWGPAGAFKLYHSTGRDKEVDDALYPGDMGVRIYFTGRGWSMNAYHDDDRDRYSQEITSDRNTVKSEQLNHIIIWVQNRRVRVYHDGAKVMDAPTVLAPNTKFSRFVFGADHEDNRPFFSNIKITTASPDVRSKLLTEGKIISYGINFDSGRDVIKPESYGAVKAIADVLKENPDVRVKVIGHTDADGKADANLDLSQRRAAAVKAYLGKEFGIDGSRIETDGMGQNEPLAPNDTPENKAKNRRVEFVKL